MVNPKMNVTLQVDDKGSAVVRGFGDAAANASKRGVRGFRNITRQLGEFKSRLKPSVGLVGKLGAAFAAYGVGRIAKSFIDTAAAMEKYETTLGTVLGSATKAKEMMQWVKNFASETPFEVKTLTEAATKLEAYGMDAKQYMKTLGNTAAAMGKPLMQAVEMIADAAQGEFERMKEFGFRAADVAKRAGFESVKAMTASRDNLIKGTETLMAMLESRYAGGMEALSKTWDGMVSNLKDTWTNFQHAVMEAGIFNFLKAGLLMVQTKIKELKEAGQLKTWATGISDAFLTGFESIVKGAAYVADAFRGWKMIFEGLKAAFGLVVEVIAKGVKGITSLLDPILGISKKTKQLFDDIQGWGQAIQNQSAARITALANEKAAHQQVGEVFDQLREKAAELGRVQEKAADSVKKVGEKAQEAKKMVIKSWTEINAQGEIVFGFSGVGSTKKPIMAKIAEIRNKIALLASSTWEVVLNLGGNLMAGLEKAWNRLKEITSKVWKATVKFFGEGSTKKPINEKIEEVKGKMRSVGKTWTDTAAKISATPARLTIDTGPAMRAIRGMARAVDAQITGRLSRAYQMIDWDDPYSNYLGQMKMDRLEAWAEGLRRQTQDTAKYLQDYWQNREPLSVTIAPTFMSGDRDAARAVAEELKRELEEIGYRWG